MLGGGGGGGVNSSHYNNQSSLTLMNKNLIDLGLNEVFKKGLLEIVRLESTCGTSYHESSASLRLLNSLVKFMQSLPKNDESVPSSIEFKLRMLETLVKNQGSNEVIKQAVQAIIHKLMKSMEFI